MSATQEDPVRERHLKTQSPPGPAKDTPNEIGRTGGYLAVVSRKETRSLPTPGGLLRRRWMVNTMKFVLPAAAVVLLASIALWPEFNDVTDKARFVYNGLRAMGRGADDQRSLPRSG